MTVPSLPLVITATPTLFKADESLDIPAIRAHLKWLQAKGVDALFPAGTTGEFPSLTNDERIQILDLALEVFPADSVYLHVGAATARQAEDLVRRAVEHGATRLAAITPFFQPAPEDQVVEYYRRLVSAAGTAQVFAYLFEARTTTVSNAGILARLIEVGVAGVKLSGETDASVQTYLDAAPEGFTVFSGNDVSFGWLVEAGGHGIISGVSSAYPEPFVNLRDALIAGDADQIALWQPRVKAAVAAVNGGSLTHLKDAIASRGFEASPVRSAVASASTAELDVINALGSSYNES
ncbi:dihydrodipicolinate synthase family protein [Cryobacterium sp. Y62]|uniref:dihydrodipicolinate synthase family protein n=1 Tax=Cryobacterium sp. Y62 TaxID=2048284 RepID=UPI000CE4353F|nr:dihydrodipicolinate synthase family protein [Cryobacterium sp. Y62]